MLALRDHPQMRYFGIKSWPPVWVNTHVAPTKKISGEIGCLIGTVFYPDMPRRLFLKMELDAERYMGCLVMSDAGFCRQLDGILKSNVGRSIKEIGDLDLSHTL
jgi:hypothetical protein